MIKRTNTRFVIGLFSLLMACSPELHAQVLDTYGLRLSAMSSTIRVSIDVEDLEYIQSIASEPGIGLGLFGEKGVSPLFSVGIQAEYHWNRYQYEAIRSAKYGIYTERVQHHSISVPLLARLHLPFAKSVSVFAGSQLDFQLHQTQNLTIERAPESDESAGKRGDTSTTLAPQLSYTGTFLNRLKRVTLGGTVGGTLDLNRGLGIPLTLDIRYMADFTESGKDPLLVLRRRTIDMGISIFF